LLLTFDRLIMLRKTNFSRRLAYNNFVTEALNLTVIKTIQDFVSELCQPGGIPFPSSGGTRCRRQTRRTPIARPIARPCNLAALFLIAIRERLRILVSGIHNSGRR
jgi:hypothetical protein